MKRWIYELTKEQAVSEATRRGLNPTGTLDDLRRRLSRHVSAQVNMFPLAKTDSATDLAPASGKPPAPPPPIPPHDDAVTHAKAMNQIRKWGCHFDGRDPLAFLERIDELQMQYRYPGNLMLEGLPEMLRGDALAWYRNNRAEWNTWADFTFALRTQYLPRRYQARLARDIQDRRQKVDEPFTKYSTELLTMIRRAGNFTTEEKVDRVYENMRTEYKFFVRLGSHPTLADLTDQATEFEALRKAQNQETRGAKQAVNTATTPTGPYDRDHTCWRCKQRGHTRFNCQRPARKFCSQCGKDGVFTRDCHPRPGNGSPAGEVVAATRPVTEST